jgi:hypothetical protein
MQYLKFLVHWTLPTHSVHIFSVLRIQDVYPGSGFFNIPDPGSQIEKNSVSDTDPDPHWIRIQLSPWIRIRIRNPDPDSQSGSGSRKLKMAFKREKNGSISCFEELYILSLRMEASLGASKSFIRV